ncbi:MAG: glycolate oxidase subunit GlcF, partial [Albidovulum sp.]
MQTHFTEDQLRDPGIARANEILRACVHCGFCTATCPTYQVLGDELDSPRGRIYLIKEMLESGRAADERVVRHIDRCLSCLACMTTCPSGVHYMHLVDHARAHIEKTYRRPWRDRLLRWVLARVIPYPTRFRLALLGAKMARPFAGLLPDARLRAMVAMAPKQVPPVSRNDDPQVFPAEGPRRMRVALMTGCAQKALNTDINDATIRLLRRLGCEVVVARGAGCCGALTHHMGREAEAHRSAEANIRAWMAEKRADGLDAIVINTSGCGTTVKDYGHMFRTMPVAAEAAEVAGLACDVTELLVRLKPAAKAPEALCVAYHAACSLQHGQKVTAAPKALLKAAGFEVVETGEFEALETADLAIVVNPNNPDGRLIAPADLLSLSSRLAAKGG